MKFIKKDLGPADDASRGRLAFADKFKNVLAVIIVLGIVYISLGLIADLIAKTIPETWEAKLASDSLPLPKIGKPSKAKDSDPSYERVTSILNKLLKHSEVRPLPYQIKIVNLKSPNAFAVPGGMIGVTRPLLEKVKKETSLALVIGHELGHHQYRHALSRMGRAIIFSMSYGLLFGKGDSSVAHNVLALAEMGYGRKQEIEADQFGMKLVVNAYDNTDDCLEFYEMMRDEKLGVNSTWKAMLTTHPATPLRIENLKKYRQKLLQEKPSL